MSEIGKSIDQVVNSDLAMRLKQLGYRKNARVYYVREANYTKIVQVRASGYNLARQGHFQVMLGVYFPELIEILEKPQPAGVPHYDDCVVWSSIGREVFTYTQRKDDLWYDIDLDLPTDLVELAHKLGDNWTQYGQPWIDHMTNLEEAALELERFRLYEPAIATYLSRGNHAKVSELVAQLTTRYPEAEYSTKQWIARHGFH